MTVTKLLAALAYSPAHLVHLGSAAEYGPSTELAPAHETSVARPVSDYGTTKLAATEMICQAVEDDQVSATVLRVFNVIGAGNPTSTLVGQAVRDFRKAVQAGSPSVTFGSLDGGRDFIDVRDVARAVLAASRPNHSTGWPTVVNVGRGIPVSSRWVVHRLARIAHFEGQIIEQGQGFRAQAPCPGNGPISPSPVQCCAGPPLLALRRPRPSVVGERPFPSRPAPPGPHRGSESRRYAPSERSLSPHDCPLFPVLLTLSSWPQAVLAEWSFDENRNLVPKSFRRGVDRRYGHRAASGHRRVSVGGHPEHARPARAPHRRRRLGLDHIGVGVCPYHRGGALHRGRRHGHLTRRDRDAAHPVQRDDGLLRRGRHRRLAHRLRRRAS